MQHEDGKGTNIPYLECEKRWVFFTLMLVGGFYGAFTYTLRGGVFCNAQTANVLLFGVSLGQGHWQKASYYLIPMGAYLLGAIVSEALPRPMQRHPVIRWETLLIFFEMLVVAVLGFVPESAPFQISQVAVNFICSMQYNTFRQAQGIPMATTFCTNHIRQIGVFLVKSFRKQGDSAIRRRVTSHLIMIVCFAIGAGISAALGQVFAGRAIWFTLIPLGVVLVNLLYADRHTERGHMAQNPHGH